MFMVKKKIEMKEGRDKMILQIHLSFSKIQVD